MTSPRGLGVIAMLGGLLAGALLAVGSPGSAHACSCAPLTAKQYVDGADTVFIGRAGKVEVKGDRAVQRFEVLQPIKGKPGAVFELVRNTVASPCHRGFKAGEVAVLFVSRGYVGLCGGNFDFSGQAEELRAYFAAAGMKRRRPPRAAVETALGRALAGYLHDRPRVEVVYPPLAGTSLQAGKTELVFVRKPGKPGKRGKAGKRGQAVVISEAGNSGSVHYLAGSYDTEGLIFRVVLLGKPDKPDKSGKPGKPESYEVLGAFVAER